MTTQQQSPIQMERSKIQRLIDLTTRSFRRERNDLVDDELIFAIRSGDQKSLGELFQRHHTSLVDFLARMGADDPEDVVQDMFLTMRRKLESYEARGESAGKFLRKIAYNNFRTSRRGTNRRRLDDVSLGGFADDRSTITGKISRADLLEHAMKFLSPENRELLVLWSEKFSAAEIAEMRSSTVGAVNTALNRARNSLKAKQAEMAKVAAAHE